MSPQYTKESVLEFSLQHPSLGFVQQAVAQMAWRCLSTFVKKAKGQVIGELPGSLNGQQVVGQISWQYNHVLVKGVTEKQEAFLPIKNALTLKLGNKLLPNFHFPLKITKSEKHLWPPKLSNSLLDNFQSPRKNQSRLL